MARLQPTSTRTNDDLRHLSLVCFGPPSATLDGREPPPDVLWRKHIALLTYLALTPNRTRTRDHLIGLFWPEKAEDKARHSLNEALRRLRLSLGTGRLLTAADSISLTGEALSVDALEFDACYESDPARAVALVAGEFLEGFTLGDAPEFDLWVSHQQRAYRQKAAPAFVAVGEAKLARSQFVEALEAGRHALQSDSHHEPAVNLMIRASALLGDQSGALATYHHFKERLAEELGEQTSRELDALVERVRKHRFRKTPVPHAHPEPPLVGRAGEHEVAFSLVSESLTNGPRTLLIIGDPGMGKSRLLAECQDRLILNGAVVASARPLESDYDAPWSTLRALMRGGLLHAPGLAATDPAALAVLAAMVPELAERVEPREPRDHGHAASALASLMRTVAEDQPLALILDDANLSDGSTLGALYGALAQLGPVPVAVLLAARHMAQDTPRELVSLQSEIGRSLPGACVRLPALTEDEMRQLIADLAVWCDNNEEIDRLTRRLVFETSGDPFLAVTLLRGLTQVDSLREDAAVWPIPRQTYESPLPIPMPNLVRMSIIARVTPLPKETQHVLAAATLGAPAIDLDLVAQLTRMSRSAVEDRLPDLERHRFITLDGERYTFAAPLIARVVHNEFLTRGQRQTLRKRAIEFLEGRDDLESQSLCAELMARAEPGAAAFDKAMTVAQAALDVGATRTVRRAIHAAERALNADEGERRERLDALRARFEGHPDYGS
jgi:DNA-binding SARP family transcriptional activator